LIETDLAAQSLQAFGQIPGDGRFLARRTGDGGKFGKFAGQAVMVDHRRNLKLKVSSLHTANRVSRQEKAKI